MEKVFRYAFGISVKILEDNSKQYANYSLGIAEEEYQMLNQLSQYNYKDAIEEVVFELEKVARWRIVYFLPKSDKK